MMGSYLYSINFNLKGQLPLWINAHHEKVFLLWKEKFSPKKDKQTLKKKSIKYNLVQMLDLFFPSGITIFSTMKPEQCVQSMLSKARVLLDDF